jgi:hypothetical protein
MKLKSLNKYRKVLAYLASMAQMGVATAKRSQGKRVKQINFVKA